MVSVKGGRGHQEARYKPRGRREGRGWNIANHQISILMLRGVAVVKVGLGVLLGSFEIHITNSPYRTSRLLYHEILNTKEK